MNKKLLRFPYLAVLAILGQRLTFLDIPRTHVEFIVYFHIVYLVHLRFNLSLPHSELLMNLIDVLSSSFLPPNPRISCLVFRGVIVYLTTFFCEIGSIIFAFSSSFHVLYSSLEFVLSASILC